MSGFEPGRLLDAAIGALDAHGARGDAYLEHTRSAEVQVRDGEVEAIRQAETRGIGIRAMVGGRLGFAHTTRLDPAGIAASVDDAVALAAHASERASLPLAVPGEGSGDLADEGEALLLRDPAIDDRTMATRAGWIRTAEQAARAVDDRVVRTESAGVVDTESGVWMATTTGLRRHYRKTLVEASLEVVAEDADRKQPGGVRTAAVRWGALPSAAAFGRRAGLRAIRLLGGEPVRTGEYPVVFAPEVGWGPLGYLESALDGEALSQGRSWLSGDADPVIGSELVTIRDRGRLPGGVGSRPFDGEGVDTGETILVDRGRVTGRLTDLASAAKLGERSSGHASRSGYASLPGIDEHNLTLDPGTATAADLVGGVREGLWIYTLSGWWIGNDASNETFSSAAAGLWIEAGKVVRPVARVTVSASLRDLFGGVDAVGSDLVLDGTTCTPTYRVARMTVSGE